jgi:hypothetical protein
MPPSPFTFVKISDYGTSTPVVTLPNRNHREAVLRSVSQRVAASEAVLCGQAVKEFSALADAVEGLFP